MTEVPDYAVLNVSVPSGKTYAAGDVLLVESLDTTISGNYSVFTPVEPATANLGKQMAIVINGGFEKLADGRRPEGQPDFTQYTFTEGDIMVVVVLVQGLTFEISTDCITGTVAVGNSIHPVNAATKSETAATTPTGTYSALTTLATKYFRAGGLFGTQFINTVVARVKQPTA
jgi:hypothetical protein